MNRSVPSATSVSVRTGIHVRKPSEASIAFGQGGAPCNVTRKLPSSNFSAARSDANPVTSTTAELALAQWSYVAGALKEKCPASASAHVTR